MRTLHTITPDPKLFDAPIGEVRSTCRLGRGWLDKVTPGDIVEMTIGPTDGERNPFGVALILRTEFLHFYALELSRHIATNHSIRHRQDIDALHAAMVRAYGDKFNQDALVTVVFYSRFE